MFSDLFRRLRHGENTAAGRKRTDRFIKRDKLWYFKTREGFEVGPFQNHSDAQYALFFFVECADWPTNNQLADFIEGCRLNAGFAV